MRQPQVGDKVRLVRGKDTPPGDTTVNTTGVVVGIDWDDYMPYFVKRDDDGFSNWYRPDEVRLMALEVDTSDANVTVLEGEARVTFEDIIVGDSWLSSRIVSGENYRVIIQRIPQAQGAEGKPKEGENK